MKISSLMTMSLLLVTGSPRGHAQGDTPSFEFAPPVVVRTVPVSGAEGVDPSLSELSVTYSKPMQDGSWSWSTWGEKNFPELTGKPHYLPDARTCVVPVKLESGRFYAIWLNSEKFRNFKDTHGTPAVPYLFTFRTAGEAAPAAAVAPVPEAGAVNGGEAKLRSLLNADQKTVWDWTHRQFRGFFDARTFEGWTPQDRQSLEERLTDALKGPMNREYYQAINSLAALHATNALPELRRIGLERRDKDNRDRWMSIRALGMLGDRASVPELVHLVYHGNANTRWWAQISLVRLTEQNFGADWQAWGRWWNEHKAAGESEVMPEIRRWWEGQAENEKLAESLADSDRKFLEGLRR
ncbi:MAG: HEAT repeat domain-containing protein [Verrucomicrobiales bacterium]|nr:HEAT repeat domain-containing protein [Verrucomicrobiales bacterium]